MWIWIWIRQGGTIAAKSNARWSTSLSSLDTLRWKKWQNCFSFSCLLIFFLPSFLLFIHSSILYTCLTSIDAWKAWMHFELNSGYVVHPQYLKDQNIDYTINHPSISLSTNHWMSVFVWIHFYRCLYYYYYCMCFRKQNKKLKLKKTEKKT